MVGTNPVYHMQPRPGYTHSTVPLAATPAQPGMARPMSVHPHSAMVPQHPQHAASRGGRIARSGRSIVII